MTRREMKKEFKELKKREKNLEKRLETLDPDKHPITWRELDDALFECREKLNELEEELLEVKDA